MTTKILFYVLSLFLLSHLTLQAQSDEVIRRLVDRLSDEETNIEELEQLLWHLYRSPVSINEATEDDLQRIFFLSPYQIEAIIDFRNRHGGFRSLEELRLVDGISIGDYRDLSPFIYLKPIERDKKVRDTDHRQGEVLARTALRLPHKEGFMRYTEKEVTNETTMNRIRRSRFKGTPLSFLLRVSMKAGEQWDTGFTLENDSGERFFGKYRPLGFDFMSGYIRYRSNKSIRQILCGDFQVKWGEGLVVWSGYSFNRSIRDKVWLQGGITPHRSTSESCFFRGLAVTLELSTNVEWDWIGSYKRLDGRFYTMESLGDQDTSQFATVSEEGLHRNESEESIRRQVDEFVVGSRMEWNSSWFRLGMIGLFYHFTPALYRFPSRSYWRDEDSGYKRLLGGVYIRTSYRNLFLSGEIGRSAMLKIEREDCALKNDWAFLLNLNYLTDRWAIRLVGRYYGRCYQARYAGAFAAYSGVGNEKGIYASVSRELTQSWRYELSGDYYCALRPRYRLSEPNANYVIQMILYYTKKQHEFDLRSLWWKKREDGNQRVTTAKRKEEIRLRYRYRLSDYLSFQTQWSGVHYSKSMDKQWGILGMIRGEYESSNSMLRLACVCAYASTDGYESRLYISEPTLRYMNHFTMLYGDMLRFTFRGSYRITPCWEIQLKSSLYYTPKRAFSGSGADRIDGKMRYDGVLQLLFRW